jgi:hypothetical protein
MSGQLVLIRRLTRHVMATTFAMFRANWIASLITPFLDAD